MNNYPSVSTWIVCMKIALSVIFLTASTQSFSDRLDLDCTITDENKYKKFHISLDETTGQAVQSYTNGKTFSTKANFSTGMISYAQTLYSSEGILKLLLEYSIDRKNLSVSEIFSTEIIDSDVKHSNPKIAARRILTKMGGTCVVNEIMAHRIQPKSVSLD